MPGPELTAVFSSDELGGSELFNLEFLRTARRRGVRVNAVLPGAGSLLTALDGVAERVEVVPIPDELISMSRFQRQFDVRHAPARGAAFVAYLRRLRRTLACFGGPTLALGLRAQLATAAGAWSRGPYVWVVHEVVPPGPVASMWRLASYRASHIMTYSRAAAGQAGLRGRDVTVHGVRLDLARYAAVPAVQDLRRLGLVGDLVELKNHLAAIEILNRIRDRAPESSLLLVGRDKSRWVPRTADYARRVRDAVNCTPGVQLTQSAPEAMPALMADLDLLLHLSTVQETFGRVVVEAMAAGRPVVAFDHGAVAELVEHGVTGYLCPVGDLDAVASAVLALHAPPEAHRRMGELARERALTRFAENPAARDTLGDALAHVASITR
jgi:glycosyltransferase involved in cell wall biosynthesis